MRYLLSILALLVLSVSAQAQIAFDNSAGFSGNANPFSNSYSVGSGSNRYMVVSTMSNTNCAVPCSGTGITYGASTLTYLTQNVDAGEYTQLFWLSNPASGNNTLSVYSQFGVNVFVTVSTYSGVFQGAPAQFVTGQASGATTVSLTTMNNGSWLVLGASNQFNGTTWTSCSSSPSGGTIRSNGSSDVICDTNGPVTSSGTIASITVTPPFGANPVAAVLAELAPSAAAGSMTALPAVIPASHSGNITLTLSGGSTSWTGGSTVFTVSGVSGVTKVSQNVVSNTSATIVVTTSSSTGTLTVAETVTGTASATTTVSTEVLSLSVTTSVVSAATAITITGTNSVWTQETASTLFSLSGGLASAFQATPTVTSDTTATATLIAGWNPGATTVTDNATGITATFTGTLSAPVITSGPTATPNSPSSILVVWSTNGPASSQASCTPALGGTTISTPVVHPYNTQTGWGVTSHSIPVTGLAASTAYNCSVQSINADGTANGNVVGSVTTSAPITSIQPTLSFVSKLTRGNDQFPTTGRSFEGDTQYGVFAANGYYVMCEDCDGVNGVNGNSVGLIRWSTASTPMTVADLTNPTQLPSFGSSTPYPGSGWGANGLLSVQGTIYFPVLEIGTVTCCGTTNIIKTNDYFTTSIAPSSNIGPHTAAATGIDFPKHVTATITAGSRTTGVVTLTTSSALNPAPPGGNAWILVSGSGCSPSADGNFHATVSGTSITYSSGGSDGTCTPTGLETVGYAISMDQDNWLVSPIEPCQDYGGSSGQFSCVWNANDDGWVYFLGQYTYLLRVRIEDLTLQDFSKFYCYTGSQSGADGLADSAWTSVVGGGCVSMIDNGEGPYTGVANTFGWKNFINYLPDFNRFILLSFVGTPVAGPWPLGEIAIYDLGQYPWGKPVLIGSVSRDLADYPSSLGGFPNLIMPTYVKTSSSPLSATVTVALSGGLFIGPTPNDGTTNYSNFYQTITLVPAATVPAAKRPTSSSNSRTAHIANGLDIDYEFTGNNGTYTLKNSSPNDPAGKYNYTSSVPLLFDAYGLDNFGEPTSVNVSSPIIWTGQQSLAMSTPYTKTLTSWTNITVFGHVPYSYQSTIINPVASGEVVINKSGDLKIARNGTAATWTVTVNGTSLGSVAITDGTIGAIVVECSAGQASVYLSNAIGTTLPLTPTLGPTSVGTCTMSSNPLVLGDGTQSLWGVLSKELIWNRALTTSELIQEMAILRGNEANSGVLLAGLTVNSINVSNTQAILAYTAPTTDACSLKASESATMSPLVHDVDPALFSGSSVDSRAGSITNGLSRTFVLGQRVAQPASDNFLYSRALPVNSTLYYQISCDSLTASGSFATANIPLGNTYNEDLPSVPSPSTTTYFPGGQYAYPQFKNWDNTTGRSEQVKDPGSGLVFTRLTMPGDQTTGNSPAGDHTFSQVSNPSSNWTTPNNVLADDSSYAHNTTNDWLILTDQNLQDTSSLNWVYPINSVTFSTKAWCSGTCSSDNQEQVAITVNGVSPWPTSGTAVIQSATLGTSALPSIFTVAGTTTAILDSWTPAGTNPLTMMDVAQRTGSVTVDSSGNVTWANGFYFYPNWVAGSLVTIDGSLCTITSAVTSLAFTVTPSACSPTLTVPQASPVAYSANNFGFMIRKPSGPSTINVQYAKYSVVANQYIGWPSSSSPEICSQTATQNTSTGDMGFNCVINGGLPMYYWVDTSTLTSNYLGNLFYASQSGTDGWGSGYINNSSTTLVGTTSTSPQIGYTVGTDNASKLIILKCTVTSTNVAGNLSITPQNLTPSSTNKDLLALMTNFTSGNTPSFNSSIFNSANIVGIQNGKVLMNFNESQQDTLSWIGVFDPAKIDTAAGCVGGGNPGCIIAAQSTWAVAPCRWCVLHTLFQMGTANVIYASGKFWDSAGNAGGNPYYSTVTSGTFGASPTYAAGASTSLGTNCPGGSQGCDIVTVDGEPCNPSPVGADPLGCPRNGSLGYLQATVVGDLFTIGPNLNFSELVQLVAKSGNQWLIQRAVSSAGFTATPLLHSGTLTLYTECSAIAPYGSTTWIWDYVNDPHGLNAGGAYITTAYYYDHADPKATAIVGDDGAGTHSIAPFNQAYAVNRTGLGLPTSFYCYGCAFDGTIGASFYDESAQPHAMLPDTLSNWFADIRPVDLIGPNLVNTATNITGNLYKFTGTVVTADEITNIGGATTNTGIDRKIQDTMKFCGSQPLVDVSGPSSSIGGTSSDSYKACFARNNNECTSGAIPGDIYINCPNATVSGCLYYPHTDMCVFNTGAYTNNVQQIGYSGSNDQYGLTGRQVTKGLMRERGGSNQTLSVHALPDNSAMLLLAPLVNGAQDQVLIGKLPPFPSSDSYSRNTFVPITLSLIAPTGLSVTNAIVEFGYAENGSSTSYFCTSRQDVCTSTSTTVGAVPFKFATEGTGNVESGITGLACSTSCSPVIPGISGRVLYYNVKYRTSGNTVVSQSGQQAVVVP